MNVFLSNRGTYLIVLLLAMTPLPARGALLFDNGQVNDFSGTDTTGADVQDSTTGDPTTLNALSGATLGSTQVLDHSILNVQSGATFINTISGQDLSTVNVLGGDIVQLDLLNESVGTISGGAFSCSGRCVGLFDTADVTISGGTFGNPTGISILAQQGATATLNSGVFQGDVRAADDSAVEVLGGSLSDVTATEGAILTLYGSDFVASEGGNPVLTGYGEIIDQFNGTITGTLSDGTPLNVSALNGVGGSKIVLAEASSPPGGYSAVANAQASVHGKESLAASGWMNAMALLLLPTGAVFGFKFLAGRMWTRTLRTGGRV